MKEAKFLKNSCKTMVFKCWSGKKNSVFLSLKRQIKISTLSIAYFLFNVFGVDAQTDTIQMEEIKISAYRTKVSFANAPRVIHLVSGTELSEAPVSDINDVLKSLMNIDVRERGAHGIQADLNIRGGSFEQNLVLINGVRMSDPQTGHFQMNLPIDINDIERIELLNGPSSSLYGNNAFSGAINIITGMSGRNMAKVSLLGGQYALYGSTVSLNISSEKFRNYLSASIKASDGHIENTDFNILNLFYQSKLSLKPGEFQFQAGFADKAFGANSFYTPVYPNQFEQNKTYFANLSFLSSTNFKFSPSVYWRRNTDRFELFRENPPAWYTSHNYHLTDVYGFSFQTNFKTFLGQSALGFDLNAESILSNRLGETLENPIAAHGYEGVFYTNGKSRQNLNIFFENQFELKKLKVSAKVMANFNSMFNWNFYPGIETLYTITPRTRIMASLNWSGRLPSYTDLYYVGPSNMGNIKLLPEKALNYEIGARHSTKIVMLQTAIFYRAGNNIIDWTKPHVQDKWQSSNITSINTFGYELIGKYIFKSTQGKHSIIRNMNLSYTWLKMDKSSSEFISKYVLDYLKHHISISLAHGVYKNIVASWAYNFQYRNGTYLPYNQLTRVFEDPVSFEPVSLVDFKLAYTSKNWDIFLQVKNIFDLKHQNIENVQLPGRWVSGGLILKLYFDKNNKSGQN
jgi:vitamin B12 transporter